MAAKIRFTGAPCPTVDYDGEPCEGEMDYIDFQYIDVNGEQVETKQYVCAECNLEVFIRSA